MRKNAEDGEAIKAFGVLSEVGRQRDDASLALQYADSIIAMIAEGMRANDQAQTALYAALDFIGRAEKFVNSPDWQPGA